MSHRKSPEGSSHRLSLDGAADSVTDEVPSADQGRRLGSPSRVVDNSGGPQGSRWSAVNAYRQAREAAERATAGTGLDGTECLSWYHRVLKLVMKPLSACYVTIEC